MKPIRQLDTIDKTYQSAGMCVRGSVADDELRRLDNQRGATQLTL